MGWCPAAFPPFKKHVELVARKLMLNSRVDRLALLPSHAPVIQRARCHSEEYTRKVLDSRHLALLGRASSNGGNRTSPLGDVSQLPVAEMVLLQEGNG